MLKGLLMKLRFKKADGTSYPDWATMSLSDVLNEHKEKSTGKEDVHSVSVHKGIINQIEHLGRVFASSDTSKYNLVKPYDIVYTKSPTGDFPLGIIKQNLLNKKVIVSPLYGVYTPTNQYIGFILHTYFESNISTYNYINPLAQKGAKNTISITNDRFLEGTLHLPTDPEEQEKIADYLSALDEKITLIDAQLSQLNLYKKAQLQTIFSPENTENWRTSSLGDHITCKRGGSISKSDLSDQGQSCILYGELYTKYTEIIDKVYSKTLKNMNDSLSQKYDVIIPTSGETAEDIALATSCVLLDNIILGGDLMILRPDLNKINGVFLTYYIRSIYKIISPLGQGVSVVHLYWKNLSQLPLPLPSLEEQAKIADYLSALDDKITNTQQSLEQIKSYKLAMLQKMIT